MEKNALELCTWKEKSTTSDVMTIDFFLLGNVSSPRQAQLKLVTGDFVIDAEDSSYCGKRRLIAINSSNCKASGELRNSICL